MERPYYAHVPRNRYGESLFPNARLTICSVHAKDSEVEQLGEWDYTTMTWKGVTIQDANKRAEQLNDEHETHLAFSAGI